MPTAWTVVTRRRGGSAPAGARFDLAERVMRAGPRREAAIATGPMFWPAALEDVGRRSPGDAADGRTLGIGEDEGDQQGEPDAPSADSEADTQGCA